MSGSYANGMGERDDFLKQLDNYLKGRVRNLDPARIDYELLSAEASEHFQRSITPETVRWRLGI